MQYDREELLRQKALIEQQLSWIKHKLAEYSEDEVAVEKEPEPTVSEKPAPWDEPSVEAPRSSPTPPPILHKDPTPAPWEEETFKDEKLEVKSDPAKLDTTLPSGIKPSKLLDEMRSNEVAEVYSGGGPSMGMSSGQKVGCFILVAIICLGFLAILFLLPQLLY